MSKKKKIIIISIVAVIVLAIIIGLICFFVAKNSGENKMSKVQKLYDNLKNKTSYSFTTTLDENNKLYYAKLDGKAYTDTVYQGNESKFIIKDGNSYLLADDIKGYYTYTNNEVDLNKIELALEEIKDESYVEGTEKVDNKNYSYEEYNGITGLSIGMTEEEGKEIKTRFYFKGNKLEYIKTIDGDKQELLKVETSDKVDSNLFEIPSDYKEM